MQYNVKHWWQRNQGRRHISKEIVVMKSLNLSRKEENFMVAVVNTEVTKSYLTAQDVMEITGCSKRKAYYIIASLNKELEQHGAFYLTGKVNKAYFMKRWNGVIQ